MLRQVTTLLSTATGLDSAIMKARLSLGFAGLLVLGGCANPVPPAQPTPVIAADQRSDETLGIEVRRRLTAAGGDLVGVVVAVSDGAVTLRGSVANTSAALRAEAAVRGVSGVKIVRNELLIRGTGY